MKVKDIIGECLQKLGEKNFVNAIKFSDAEKNQLDRLVAALNIIYREVVTEYLPLFAEETVTLVDNKLCVKTLNCVLLYPMYLKKHGVKHVVKSLPSGIESDFSGEAILKYAYLPNELTLDGELDDFRITTSALSDGTLGEYYFQNKVFDLAKSYDMDFRSVVSMLRYKGRELSIKARRWEG